MQTSSIQPLELSRLVITVPGLTIRNLKCQDKIPDKYVIVRTYQTIFGYYIMIISLLNTIYVAM